MLYRRLLQKHSSRSTVDSKKWWNVVHIQSRLVTLPTMFNSCSPKYVLRWYRMLSRNVCMGGYHSGTSHKSRRLCISITSTNLTNTLAEMQTFSSPSRYNSLPHAYWASIRVRCGIVSAMQLGSTSHLINLFWFGKSRQPLKIENVQAKAYTTRLLGFVNFCRMSFIHVIFVSFVRIKILNPDSSFSNLYNRPSCWNIGMSATRFVYPACAMFSSPGTS